MLMHRPQTPQPGFGSITLLQKFTPCFKILDPRLLFLDSMLDLGIWRSRYRDVKPDKIILIDCFF